MNKILNNLYKNKSILKNIWKLKEFDERSVLSISQKNDLSFLLSKLLYLRNISEEQINDYLNPNIIENFPDPFKLKDMDKSINRVIQGLQNNESFGIIADYDVDGSTSAAVLYKFLISYTSKILLKIPNRLTEGYGPNLRIMNQMQQAKVNIVFTLDCGTTAFDIIDNNKYKNIDVIVIDHHISESLLPKVYSIINPNRYDENNKFTQMAAVGVTFLFLMGLRKQLRESIIIKKNNEPNLLSLLDLVALGTICDVVKLQDYNRSFVKKGLELIKTRHHKGIAKIIDNSKINFSPTSLDLGFIVGPQLNAASRIDDSFLSLEILITSNIDQIEKISKKLFLLNEKRKLIEQKIYENALFQAETYTESNYILVYGDNWHNGVLGIVASKLVNLFNKPIFVISFTNNIGVGSARSIENIDIGKIIIAAKNNNILMGGGGHNMAAGLHLKLKNLNNFKKFLDESFSKFNKILFEKIQYFDSIISVNEFNNFLLEDLEKLEPYGNGNSEPKFIINDLKIENIKILKEKHILVFFKNEKGNTFKGISFNCINNVLGEYLLNFKNFNFKFACTVSFDHFSKLSLPQIIIIDAMILN